MRFLTGVAIAMACGTLVSAHAPEGGGQLPVRRVWASFADSASLTSHQRETLELEAQEIWAAFDVEITWTSTPPEPVDDRDFYVMISVDAVPPTTRPTPADPALGKVLFVPVLGHYRQMIYASTERTRSFMRRSASSINPMMIDRLLGRALGRVVAHEMGHLLLGTTSHAIDGLMKPSFSARDLLLETRRHLTLPPALVAGLPPALPSAAPAPANADER